MAVYQSITLTDLGQDPVANTSQVRILWQSTQTGGSFNETARSARYTLWVNGAEVKTTAVTYILPLQQTVTIAEETVTVSHNEKGEALVAVTTWMNTHISAGVMELSKTLDLPKIPRASTLRAADASIGGTARISVVKRNSSYSHSIGYVFGSLSGFVAPNGSLVEGEEIFYGDSVDLQLPERFYDEIPNDRRGKCYLYLQTYDGIIPVGDRREESFWVTAEESLCRPLVEGSVTDENPVTLALTGDGEKMVRYASQAVCTLQAQGQKGAEIVTRQIAGKTVEADQLSLSNMEQSAVTFSVTDSRGYHSSVTKTVPLIPYVKLSAEATAKRENARDQAAVYISGDCFTGSFGKVENEVTVAVILEDREPVMAEVTLEGNRYYAFAHLEDIDHSRVHTIRIVVCDRVMQTEKQVTLKKAVPVFDWGEGDFSFHVPVSLDSPLPLESGGTGASSALQAAENLGLAPAMVPGEEYIAPQKWNGRQVYTKLLEFGELPSYSAKSVPHGIVAERILSCWGSTSQGKTLPYGGTHIYRMDLFCDKENVYIDTELDCSGITAIVQIFYIK